MKAPFPWFGGKQKAASIVWGALGDPSNYVEPFAGSLAVLLNRPAWGGGRIETVNDVDGLVVNAWRSMQWKPEETAEHASWPVTEADKIARLLACQKWQRNNDVERLMGDPRFCDPVVAGWWLYSVCCQIGVMKGPWASVDGRLAKVGGGVRRNVPHVGGRGVCRRSLLVPGESTPAALVAWFVRLSARLRGVNILNGDWSRAVSPGILVPANNTEIGVYFDPPYAAEAFDGVYVNNEKNVAPAVLEWCKVNGGNKRLRIGLSGYDTEHAALVDLGWSEIAWDAGSAGSVGGKQGHRERIWFSPGCKTRETRSFGF